MVDIPTLETQRLILRPQTMDDWPAYRDMMSTERAAYMGGPFTEAEAWGMFCHDTAQWQLMGHGALMIQSRGSGEVLGQVGINHGPLFPEHELGWFVYPLVEGKGYAHEAALALRNWAFGARGLATLVSYIDPENARSAALAVRLGAKLDSVAARQDPEDLVYRHPKP